MLMNSSNGCLVRCYKCGEFASGYEKILEVTDMQVGCLRKVRMLMNIFPTGKDDQDYRGECWVILMG